jgi:hypothetical protein
MDGSAFNHLPPTSVVQGCGCLGVIIVLTAMISSLIAFNCGRSYEKDFGKEVNHVSPR